MAISPISVKLAQVYKMRDIFRQVGSISTLT